MVANQASRQFVDVFQGIEVPVLAAIRQETNGTLNVHIGACANRTKAKAEVLAGLANAGMSRVRVHFHTGRDLTAPRSLERLVAHFGDGEVVYDPTEAISRAKALVAASQSVRTSLVDAIAGIFFAPQARTLFVSLGGKRFAATDKLKVAELAAIERQIVEALGSAFAGRTSECPAVRVGFGLPNAALVPVDHRSIVGWSTKTLRAVRRYWKPVAIATLFGFGADAAAAREPAVAPTNLKVTAAGISTEGEGGWFFGGALTTPLGQEWGFQGEAGVSGNDNDTVYGVGGHIFTRDPSSYLLGVFAAYASEDALDLDAARLGAEAELYLNQLSILASAGYQFSDAAALEGAFADIELRWYISDDFALSAGGAFSENNEAARIGAEWRPGFSALPGLAFRADASFGEGNTESYLGGLTYYFGADASLKDRHRKQDPASALLGLFQAVQNEQARICGQYGAPPGCN
ncbi:MAG: hypothetical protein ACKVRO_11250 [Micropepsaceae bacterium]